MSSLDPKVIIAFCLKNILTTIHVIPIWFIAVLIFEKVWHEDIGVIPLEIVVVLLYGSGVIFFVLLLIFCYYWAWYSYSSFTYSLENDGLHVNRGIILKNRLTISYSDILDVQVFINPILAKWLGIFSLHITTRPRENTAGILRKSSGITIPGLTLDVIQELRNQLINLSHVQSTQKKHFDPTSGRFR
jgi:membrane protein YdbS with pleckstrin-like domain